MDVGTNWITLYPYIYRSEWEDVHRHYTGIQFSQKLLLTGNLNFVGVLNFRSSKKIVPQPFLLHYPSAYPNAIPKFYPVKQIPNGTDWKIEDVLYAENIYKMPEGYLRHQMADGQLCLIESDPLNRPEYISGVSILQRAEGVFFSITRKAPFPFPDSMESEMESHYNKVGDILITEPFFDQNLQTRELFDAILYKNKTRTYKSVNGDTCQLPLLIGVSMVNTDTTSGLITSSENISNTVTEELIRCFPDIDIELGNWVHGILYNLSFEPEPIKEVRQLESILAKAGITDTESELIKIAMSVGGYPLVAFRYPKRRASIDFEWLFLHLFPKETPSKEEITAEGYEIYIDIMRDADIKAYRCHPLRRSDLELRNGISVTDNLSNKVVLIIGAGAVGGDVGLTLANAGVGKIIVFDPDILRSGNVIRHIGELPDVGINKTEILKHKIHRHNPFVQIQGIPLSATENLDALDKAILEADIVISTTGDSNVDLVINEAIVRLSKLGIFGKALQMGTVTKVVRVSPGESACLQCLALYRHEKEHSTNDHEISNAVKEYVDISPMDGEIIGRECGNPILAGSAADLRITADLTSNAALDILMGSIDWNVLIWSRKGLKKEICPDLIEPYSVLKKNFPTHPECHICRRPVTKKLYIIESAYQLIISNSVRSKSVETGGILIGYLKDNECAVVMEATEAGPNAIKKETCFERDAEFVQTKLDEAKTILGKKGQYLGEWHSHHDPDPMPSARDIASLTGIAQAPNYSIDEPIMIIAGYDRISDNVNKIHASCFPLINLGRFIELKFEVIENVEQLDK